MSGVCNLSSEIVTAIGPVIGGYTPGHPFDALIVGYYKDSELYYVGKVRNGFVPQVFFSSCYIRFSLIGLRGQGSTLAPG